MKIIKLSFIFATLTIAVFVFGGCRPEVVTVDSVTVRPSTVEITVDSSCQLSATIQPSDAPQDLEWFSSQPSVATVTPSGLVSAIAPGECDITASAGDKRGVCHVRVVSPVPSDPENPNNPDEPQNQNQVGFDEVGASYALFSVADGHTVHFSRGNLQYMANPQSKDKGIWRFAEHQYDFIGAASANASEFYDGWIDGFCWGTSGWNSGANEYQPWASSLDNTNYYPGSSYTNSLTDNYANADWGVYNAISNGGNQSGMWRTPTYDEWDYLLLRRAASTVAGVTNARYTKATIDYNIWGMIIFPDNFTLPATIPTINSINNPGSSMSSNSFTMDEWEQLEQNGAIFLPLAGCRNGCVGQGVYWSSTYSSEEQSYLLYFESNITVIQGGPRRMPASVRLVKD